ncbi:ATP-dependent helicase HrpB [Thalassotalea algicola]|uniref:ATP-dependent helicase HrpB n=1 Tax=Thalassotalea algicola TaxID=2716224 RepID=UPI0022A87CFF|nr:ATP-dependent helicase HrpB [Thalassotalea algicola]
MPINQIKTSFLTAIEQSNLVILTAPPGAGKSTVLPLWLLDTEFANQKIYLLQPRRVAAKNIACYLAQQLGEEVGQTIGYRLRNDSRVSANTIIEVITEGILTQLIQNDPELADANLILFDEFHERSVQADLAFALARDCQLGLREDLRLVLMSATLSNEELSTKFPEAEFIVSEGRSFPVECHYQSVPTNKFWREHALSVIKKDAFIHSGSCLVFLPGVADIKFLIERLECFLPDDLLLAPLYGELPISEQQKAMKPINGARKLVLATNIAETSLTIEGITLVIDAGFEKAAIYDSQTLTNQLIQKPISKASAIQRAGRAGRLSAGQCIRLYSEEDFQRRPEQAISDILQTDLLPVLIEAARWGVTKLSDLPFLELPNAVKEQLAWQELQQLRIVNTDNKLTAHGQTVAQLSCHPRYGNMLVSAQRIGQQFEDPNLVNLACLLAALLEERDVFSPSVAKNNADITTRISFIENQLHSKANLSGKLGRIIKQAKNLAQQLAVSWQSSFSYSHCGVLLALAFPERIAANRHQQGAFIAFNGKGLNLASEDTLNDAELLVAASTIKLKDKQLISLAAPVTLAELEAWDIVSTTVCEQLNYDEQRDKINASEQRKLGAIVLSEKPTTQTLDEQQIATMWCEQITRKGISWLSLSDSQSQLLARINWLALHQPELGFNQADEPWLLANLERWFSPYVGDIRKKSKLISLEFEMMFKSMLDFNQQQQLARCAPLYFSGPTGRKCPIRYTNEHSPIVSLPMQEVYGEANTPQVGDKERGNGVNLTLELLSPAGRPIQVTQDLAGFWQGSYNAVQKEMKGRYPKHFWPDDPANAQATRKTKKYM